MVFLKFIVLISLLCLLYGQGSRNEMRGNRDLSSSEAVVKEDSESHNGRETGMRRGKRVPFQDSESHNGADDDGDGGDDFQVSIICSGSSQGWYTATLNSTTGGLSNITLQSSSQGSIQPSAQPSSQPSKYLIGQNSEVSIICSGSSQGWYTATLDSATGGLSNITLQTPSFVLTDRTMANCFILAKTSLSYSSERTRSDREGYVSTQYGSVGTTTLGDWNDVINAVGVMGVQNFHLYLGMNLETDVCFVTYNGDLIWSGSRNYFVSYFSGTASPNWYAEHASSLTDGVSAIVLGSFTNTLPVLGKITAFKMLDGVATTRYIRT
eukprot:CAMPEP_0119051988 /NCGR_PEP_ID=MMETSP1177-20130426/73431_1 /TAXON_ID=2985 /ORGANISM="Ochromonas sp, Strain CCMP1899" /LENGTH=323 /DNA_ID=CAMNT_0007031395 /DNA_START=95 /DNA_END=1066 /DNA_ORIENTATION=-